MTKKIFQEELCETIREIQDIVNNAADEFEEEDEVNTVNTWNDFAFKCDRVMKQSLIKSPYCGYSYLFPDRLIHIAQSIECALLLSGAKPGVDYNYIDLFKLAIEAEPHCPDSGKN